MIPSEIATRLRALIDADVRALVPIHEIPTDLPDLETGQRFSARLQSPLPDGTFQALVAGRTMTLALPAGVKSGDVLELVVTGTRGQTILARPADSSDLASSSPATQPRLSAAGQLISRLLTGQGQQTATTVQSSKPAVDGQNISAATLAPALQQTISQSGLFYEAHQAQWSAGKLPLAALLQEPQAQVPITSGAPVPNGSLNSLDVIGDTASSLVDHPDASTSQNTDPNAAATADAIKHDDVTPRAEQLINRATLVEKEGVLTLKSPADGTAQGSTLRIAEQLMPIIHQQLDTLATHQINWQGEIWPGMFAQWTIVDPDSGNEQNQGSPTKTPQPWQSQLRLSMPGLGELNAQLVLTPSGVAIRIAAASQQSAETLQARVDALASALDAAGVPLTGMVIDHGTH